MMRRVTLAVLAVSLIVLAVPDCSPAADGGTDGSASGTPVVTSPQEMPPPSDAGTHGGARPGTGGGNGAGGADDNGNAGPGDAGHASGQAGATPAPSPTLGMSEALDQARDSVPEPPQVLDVSNPSVVYGRLSEGVKAWIASLGYNADQWGNKVTDCYVTAQRPDFVPASLQSFLLQYYADDRNIALAIGPSGVEATTISLQHEYNRNVQQLAAQLYDQSVQDARQAAAQQAASSENVPDLEHGDAGGSNASSSGGTGSATGSTGGGAIAEDPPEGGTDGSGTSSGNGDASSSGGAGSGTVRTGDGDSGGDAAGVEAIERKYGVDLRSGSAEFSEKELGYVDATLGALPSSYLAAGKRNPPRNPDPYPVVLQREHSVNVDGEQCYGAFNPNDPEHIAISDATITMPVDFPSPPFTEEQRKAAEFGGTMVHEMTHRVLAYDENGNFVSDLADKPIVAAWAERFGWSSNGSAWTCSRKDECVTDYAGSVNPEEDICESAMMFVYWPDKLKQVSPEKYEFLKERLGFTENNHVRL